MDDDDDDGQELKQYVQGLTVALAVIVEHLMRSDAQGRLTAILEAAQEETEGLPGRAIGDVLNHAKALRQAIDTDRSGHH